MIRITLRNQLSLHKVTLFYYVTGIFVLYFLGFNKPVVVIFGLWWAADLLPSLYLHLEYWLRNKGEQYEITTNEIIRYKRGVENTYKAEDIEKIIVYKSASMDRGGIPFLSMESYYYARIILKSNEELIMTRLLSSKLEQAVRKLPGVKYVRKKRLFCTLAWH